jgi:hypothetical protein
MQRVFNLKDIGIETPLNLGGDLRILRAEKGLPIVFLFDEEHENLNGCIDENIKNAIALISKANVEIIGVESHSGGKQWDQYYQEYMDDEEFDKSIDNIQVNNSPDFRNGLVKDYEDYLKGVECKGMLDKMECNSKISITENPLNIERSRHFIQTLFVKRKVLNLKGNLILNCGRDHNTHIADWIANGEIDNIAGFRANYIRIDTIG